MEVAGNLQHASDIDFLSFSIPSDVNHSTYIYRFKGQVPFALESSSHIDRPPLASLVQGHGSSNVNLVELQGFGRSERTSNINDSGNFATAVLSTSASVQSHALDLAVDFNSTSNVNILNI